MKRDLFKSYGKISSSKGSAIIETAAGLFILLPVFLCLVDVISLVIAQSVNDDLAKQAARYAALTSLPPGGAINDIQTQTTMQANAQTAAINYLQQTPYFNAVRGTIYPVQGQLNPLFEACNCNFNSNPPSVQVITEIKTDLPISLPFTGTTSTTFRAQQTEPIVGLQPIPN